MDHHDQECIRAYAATNDETAFVKLFSKYRRTALSLALQRTGDRELAEEITQTVFAKLAAKAGLIHRNASVAAWLRQAVILESANAMRKEYNLRRRLSSFASRRDSDLDQPPKWDGEIHSLVDQALAELDQRDQAVIRLRYYEDRTFAEIGRAFGRSESAARKQLNRALERLGRSLRERGVKGCSVSAIHRHLSNRSLLSC